MTVHAARLRIQIEFIEMPGLKLTLAPIGRLCDLPHPLCEHAVTALIENGFLAAHLDGSFLRSGRATPARVLFEPQSVEASSKEM